MLLFPALPRLLALPPPANLKHGLAPDHPAAKSATLLNTFLLAPNPRFLSSMARFLPSFAANPAPMPPSPQSGPQDPAAASSFSREKAARQGLILTAQLAFTCCTGSADGTDDKVGSTGQPEVSLNIETAAQHF